MEREVVIKRTKFARKMEKLKSYEKLKEGDVLSKGNCMCNQKSRLLAVAHATPSQVAVKE